MRFQPISSKEAEQQASRFEPLPDGDYDFQVLEAVDCQSKKGIDQIKLKLGCFASGNRQQFVWDYLHPDMQFKLRHFCECTGLLSKYDSGTLRAQDCAGRTGIASLSTEEQAGYKPRNVVEDYVVKHRDLERPQTAVAKTANKPAEDDGDSVPF